MDSIGAQALYSSERPLFTYHQTFQLSLSSSKEKWHTTNNKRTSDNKPCTITFIQDKMQRSSNKTVNQLMVQDDRTTTKIPHTKVNTARHHGNTTTDAITHHPKKKSTEATPDHQEKHTEEQKKSLAPNPLRDPPQKKKQKKGGI
ncbi:Hypothetical predicted protein [Marmota monax]|uniref:Uncharacterized protein n=1 Tax=Marmota monax TaxID=9995 RepID=A0A5E4C0J2_MARMO|nr:Hypothetical predicted protein [Marmota monax]